MVNGRFPGGLLGHCICQRGLLSILARCLKPEKEIIPVSKRSYFNQVYYFIFGGIG